MAKGMSLHIGVNEVDPNQYNGFKDSLDGCDNDAVVMAGIARLRGFDVAAPLCESAAKAQTVIDGIKAAAAALNTGDIFMLTFAGHGSQIPTFEQPPHEANDQTWALYDRFLVDNELYALWTTFKAGVRIVVVSDSCHSGTVISLPSAFVRDGGCATTSSSSRKARLIPLDIAKEVYESHQDMYDAIEKAAAAVRDQPVSASVLLLSACGDDELAQDDSPDGLFTACINQVWNGGKFPSDYDHFYEAVYKEVNAANQNQHPGWFAIMPSAAFFQSKVFSIS
jgi:hypothetical protein